MITASYSRHKRLLTCFKLASLIGLKVTITRSLRTLLYFACCVCGCSSRGDCLDFGNELKSFFKQNECGFGGHRLSFKGIVFMA